MTFLLFNELHWWEPLAAVVLVTGFAYVASRKARH